MTYQTRRGGIGICTFLDELGALQTFQVLRLTGGSWIENPSRTMSLRYGVIDL